MTIMELGALGEFVGSIAVLVTLLYLAVQVRHSRDLLEESGRTTKANLSQSMASSEIGYVGHYLRYADIWQKVVDDEEIADQVDKRRAYQLFTLFMIEAENRYNVFMLGYMDKESWESREVATRICVNLSIYPDWKQTPGAYSRSAGFRDYLETLRDV